MAGNRETMEGRPMTPESSQVDPATQRVLDGIDDPELAARYPDRAHFISSVHPKQGEMATRALFDGDPVVIVFPDGHEVLMTPERVWAPAAFFLLLAALTQRLRRKQGDTNMVQFPPGRLEVQARDSAGHPIAA